MENKTKIDLKNTSIFITGAAGFIGSNLAKRILTTVEGAKVVGLDNMNHYYDVRLKEARLDELNKFENFSFVKGNLADKETITTIFEQYKPQIVVNLGAQAGVRYSITNPDAYVEANLIGFYNILEACRHSYDEGHTPVEHLVYASSSSVYGSNKKVPYSTDDKVDNPVSLYIEAIINIVLSVILVFKFGLEGIAVGTFIGMLYRMIYLVWFINKDIMPYPISNIVKRLSLSIGTIVISCLIVSVLDTTGSSTLILWVKNGVLCFGVYCAVTVVLNFAFDKELFLNVCKKAVRRRKG